MLIGIDGRLFYAAHAGTNPRIVAHLHRRAEMIEPRMEEPSPGKLGENEL
jgi:hypothetical protein